MSEFEERSPLHEDFEAEQQHEAPPAVMLEALEADLHGAERTVGPDEVAFAIEQVVSGTAQPQELMAWIDNLRDPERAAASEERDEDRLGFLHDFEADSDRASDDAQPAGSDEPAATAPPSSFDDDYLYSVARRRRRGDDDDDEDDEGEPLGTEDTARADKKPAKES